MKTIIRKLARLLNAFIFIAGILPITIMADGTALYNFNDNLDWDKLNEALNRSPLFTESDSEQEDSTSANPAKDVELSFYIPVTEAGNTNSTSAKAAENCSTSKSSASQAVTIKSTVDSDWLNRTVLPDYAKKLYETLKEGSDNDLTADFLIGDDAFTLSASSTVDYTTLKGGDIVKTADFSGIFVTSLNVTGNANFENQRNAVYTEIKTALHAFLADHPEVFWLNESFKMKTVTPTVTRNGQKVQECFIFLLLKDNGTYSLRQADYNTSKAVRSGIKERDKAVKDILSKVTATDTVGKLRQVNDILTARNQYNTSSDLNSIGLKPHHCLSALTGSIGTNGPVCDGYSKAFKVICDRLGIPCVLEEGYVVVDAAKGLTTVHTWNCVMTDDGKWYGVDVTWNDPVVAGSNSAVSGRENQNYLMIGADTVINGLKFSVSHQSFNLISGTTISAGHSLSATALAA